MPKPPTSVVFITKEAAKEFHYQMFVDENGCISCESAQPEGAFVYVKAPFREYPHLTAELFIPNGLVVLIARNLPEEKSVLGFKGQVPSAA